MMMDGLDHPKTLDLASRLNASIPQVIGHLELLWAFTAQKTPRGNIGKWPDGTIARAAHWTGDATVFVTALHEAGFLDASQEYRFLVHDWHEHAPRWVKSKLKRASQEFAFPDCSADCSADSSGESMPSHAMPSHAMSGEEGAEPPDVPRGTSQPSNEPGESASPAAQSPPCDEGEPLDDIFIQIPLNTGSEHPVTYRQVAEWQSLYPAIDVHQSLRNIRGWNIANPKNRKTARGVTAHITSWLTRDQDKAPRNGASYARRGSNGQNGRPDYNRGATDPDAL